MDTVLFSVRAILPMLVTILIGMVFAAAVKWDKSFYRQLNAFTFHLLFPLNLFYSVLTISDAADINWRALAFLAASTVLCIGVGFAAVRAFRVAPLRRNVIIQATFRANVATIALALVPAIGGENEGMSAAFASLAFGMAAIVNNIFAVILLSLDTDPEKRTFPILSILKNPLLVGTVIGAIFLALKKTGVLSLEVRAPHVISAVAALSKAASPLALFSLGAILDLKKIQGMKRDLVLGISLRLLICPLLVIGLAVLLRGPLGITSVEMPGIIAFAASPVAISSAVMIQEMGGDTQLANHLVIWSSALSMLTLFLFLLVLRASGMI